MKNSEEKEKLEAGSVRKKVTKSKSKLLAQVGILAGVYAVVTILLSVFSYLAPFNLRFSNLLIAVVPILGLPAVFGISLGVFLANLASPLGPIDLISSGFSFLGLYALYLLRKKSVLLGLGIYSLLLSLWVALELNIILHLDYLSTFYTVGLGISFVVCILSYLFYRALKASGLARGVSEAA